MGVYLSEYHTIWTTGIHSNLYNKITLRKNVHARFIFMNYHLCAKYNLFHMSLAWPKVIQLKKICLVIEFILPSISFIDISELLQNVQ